MQKDYQDTVHKLRGRQGNRNGYGLTPAEAKEQAEELVRELGAETSTPTACVADAAMEALLDSGATDHTVGIKALSSEQLKGRYKIPRQTYNMATGQIVVDEAVGLYVPALGVTLDFRLLPGGARPLISVGRICRERGFGYQWDGLADSAVVTCPDGQVADTWFRRSCVYVTFNTPLGSAAPFTEGGGSASGSGEPLADERADGPTGSGAPRSRRAGPGRGRASSGRCISRPR